MKLDWSNPFMQLFQDYWLTIFQVDMFCQKMLFRCINDNEENFTFTL